MARPEKTEAEHRADLIKVCQRLGALNLIGAGEGNVSIRLGPRRVLATHGYSDILARYLREQGLEAAPLPTRFEGEAFETGREDLDDAAAAS